MRHLFSIGAILIVSIKTYPQLPIRVNYNFITIITPSSINNIFLELGVIPFNIYYLLIIVLISILVLIIAKAKRVLSSLNDMHDKQEQILKKNDRVLEL